MADLTPEKYWPLGSTVQKEITDMTDIDHYRHFGLISANPITGHLILVYRKGTTHVGDCGDIVIRHSFDGGTNWGPETFVYSEVNETPPPPSLDVRTAGGGYDSNGRLFIFFSTYNPATETHWVDMKYIYSDNDGNSWLPLSPNPPYNLDPIILVHQLVLRQFNFKTSQVLETCEVWIKKLFSMFHF